MCVCLGVFVSKCVYVCVFECVCVSMYIYECVHLSVHVYECVCAFEYVCDCVYICMWGGVGVCMPQCKCGGHKESVFFFLSTVDSRDQLRSPGCHLLSPLASLPILDSLTTFALFLNALLLGLLHLCLSCPTSRTLISFFETCR